MVQLIFQSNIYKPQSKSTIMFQEIPLQFMKPASICYSQTQITLLYYRHFSLFESLLINGFNKEQPLNAVKVDGKIVSYDNRRLYFCQMLNIQPFVKVWKYNDKEGIQIIRQRAIKYYIQNNRIQFIEEAKKIKTWGDAITLRMKSSYVNLNNFPKQVKLSKYSSQDLKQVIDNKEVKGIWTYLKQTITYVQHYMSNTKLDEQGNIIEYNYSDVPENVLRKQLNAGGVVSKALQQILSKLK